MQGSNFEAYVTTNSEIWKKFFKEVSDGAVAYQPFFTVDDHNQKRVGNRINLLRSYLQARCLQIMSKALVLPHLKNSQQSSKTSTGKVS